MIDLALLIAMLPIIGPILIITGLSVFVALGRPIFFRQERGGFRGSRFMLWKFRSMTNAFDRNGEPLPDVQRLRKFGQFLRSTSLDELPCVINLAKGDIGLVGPRPLMSRYLPLYSPEQIKRHNVRPGLTGWAQVNGRNNLTWEEKFALDLWYVDNHSFWLDLKILALTTHKVILRRDVNQEGEATMPLFTGTTENSRHENIS